MAQSHPVKTRPGILRTTWLILKTIQARLRFVALLVAVGAALTYWDTLTAYYEKWLHRHPAAEISSPAGRVEYFCPMHPQIIRDNPNEKCPICFMPLSRRTRGSDQAEVLPAGVISRVQLTPYRIVLAGVQTSEIRYLPLTKAIETVGFVEFDERKLARISTRVSGRSRIDKLFVNVTGQLVRKGEPLALLYNPEIMATVQSLLDAQRNGNRSDLLDLHRQKLLLWGLEADQIDEILRTGQPIRQVTMRSPISGHVIRKYQTEGEYVEEGARLYDVADLSTVWIQAPVYEEDAGYLQEGLTVTAWASAFPGREPFHSKLAFVHPHLDQSTRTLTARFDMQNPEHLLRPGMYTTVKIEVPVRNLKLLSKGNSPGAARAADRAQLDKGLILALPESAVIDTGSRKVVYRESAPGIYDGVEVQLGPRMLGPLQVSYYPVLQGLASGAKVVTNGSFLVDAETRLNPAAGSIYTGAARPGAANIATIQPARAADDQTAVRAALQALPAEDRRLAEAQGYCPINQENRLGAMGPPAKVLVKGVPVFLCCQGCQDQALAKPEQTLARVEKLRSRAEPKPGP